MTTQLTLVILLVANLFLMVAIWYGLGRAKSSLQAAESLLERASINLGKSQQILKEAQRANNDATK